MYGILVTAICWYFIIQGSLGTDSNYTPEEKTSLYLECTPQNDGSTSFWFDNYCSKNCSDDKNIFYKPSTGDAVEGDNPPTNMEIGKKNFTLMIREVRLEDDHMFTCKTGQYPYNYDHHQLNVYIQPSGDDILMDVPKELREGEEVTVKCTIERLFPKIDSKGKFTITWGEDKNSEVQVKDRPDPDKAFTHTVILTKTLTNKDDGTTIKCSLQPEIGKPVEPVQEKVTVLSPSLSTGAIVGIVLGSLAGVGLIAGGVVGVICYKKKATVS